MTQVATPNGGTSMGNVPMMPQLPTGLTPDISNGQTDIQSILLLNILDKTTNNNLFKELIQLETSYLQRSMNLLRTNPVLRFKFGGFNVDACSALARELKARTDIKEVDMILEKPVRQAVKAKYLGRTVNENDNANPLNRQLVNDIVNPLTPYNQLFYPNRGQLGVNNNNLVFGGNYPQNDDVGYI